MSEMESDLDNCLQYSQAHRPTFHSVLRWGSRDLDTGGQVERLIASVR